MAAPFQTTSFLKRTPLNRQPLNENSSASQKISSGISSLDAVIDGGLPLGSLCLLEEDEYGSYSKMIAKYFLADGIEKGNYVLAANLNESPADLLNSLPSPIVVANHEKQPTDSSDELKIAWRYENLSVQQSFDRQMGTSYDLSTPYLLTEEQKMKTAVWDGSEIQKPFQTLHGTLKNPWCMNMLLTFKKQLDKWQSTSHSNSAVSRIVISSFGSPYWEFDQHNLTSDLTATLLILKSLVRSSNAVALVTLPHHLLDERTLCRSRSISDVVFQLKSLREDRSLNDLIDVHGILELKKIINLISLKPILGQDGTTTFGFKATKRKFKIEKLHLPPALETEKKNPGDDHGSSCGTSLSKSKLDF